jgi:hypothetical protein|tara:strand:- start:5327 stop:6073 length:747 start_codon:yes stop_codon:yes gene_type:complete
MKQQLVKHIIENFTDPYELQKTYRSHPSYSLLTLEDFVPKHIVSAMAKELDNVPLEDCKHFTRAGSCMYEYNDVTKTPVQDAVIDALHSSTFIKWLQEVTDTVDLIPDPHLIGAGYVKSLTGDSLKVHCDFNWNEQIRLHRMLSLVIYLNDDWKEEWGGQLQFYDRERQTVHSKVPVGNGNAVIWSYDNFAFHGYPNPMTNPKNTSRKALRLFYYVSNAKHDDKHPPHRSLYWFDDKEKVPYDKPWTK